MGSKLSVTITNYHNRGGDLELMVKDAAISERVVKGVRIIRLKVTRKPDQHSSRLGMFAFLRNTQRGYQSLGFSQITLTFDRFSNDGDFIDSTMVDFFSVAVESVNAKGNDEELTFIAASKSGEFTISNVVATPSP